MLPNDPGFYQGKIYVDIREGSLEKGGQMRVGWSKMAIFASFARHIFRTFTFKATIYYYIVLYTGIPLVALHWHCNKGP